MKSMTKLVLAAMLVVGFISLGTPKANAADNDTIAVTVTLDSTLSVDVLPATWDIGALALSAATAPVEFKSTVGNVATKLMIASTAPAGGWTMGAAIGADACMVSNNLPEITLSAAAQQLSGSVAPYGVYTNTLTFTAPSSDTKGGGVAQGFTVTVTASAP